MNETVASQIVEVKQWLLERRPEFADLDLDFDLIENRVIDSLRFLEFVLFLEDLSGREIRTGVKNVGAFRTLRAIAGNFLHADI